MKRRLAPIAVLLLITIGLVGCTTNPQQAGFTLTIDFSIDHPHPEE